MSYLFFILISRHLHSFLFQIESEFIPPKVLTERLGKLDVAFTAMQSQASLFCPHSHVALWFSALGGRHHERSFVFDVCHGDVGQGAV